MRRGGYIASIIVSILMFFLPLTSGESLQISKPNIKAGEFWEYKLYSTYTGNYSKSAYIKISVKGSQPFVLNGREIDSIVIEITRNDTIVIGNNVTQESKYLKEYLDENLSVFRIEETNLRTGSYRVYEYDPPIGLDWPLFVNKSWTKKSRVKILEGENLSLRNSTFLYNCTHEEIVHVDAGTFSCIAVERVINGDYSNRTVQYYSPDVGFGYVKVEKYWRGGISLVTELISHGVEKIGGSESTGSGTPGFDIWLVAISLIFVTIASIIVRKLKH